MKEIKDRSPPKQHYIRIRETLSTKPDNETKFWNG